MEVAHDIAQELVQSHTAEQMVIAVEVTQLTPQERSFHRIAEQIADVNVPQNEEQNVKDLKVTPQEIAQCLSAKNMAKCPLLRSRTKFVERFSGPRDVAHYPRTEGIKVPQLARAGAIDTALGAGRTIAIYHFFT